MWGCRFDVDVLDQTPDGYNDDASYSGKSLRAAVSAARYGIENGMSVTFKVAIGSRLRLRWGPPT